MCRQFDGAPFSPPDFLAVQRDQRSFVDVARISTFARALGRYDPVTFGTVPLVLVAIALVACALPAYRASRVESLIARRVD